MDYFIYSKAPHHLKNIDVIVEFDSIWEFGHEKCLRIQPSSLKMHYNKGLEICFITKGRYNWKVEDKEYKLLPGNGFLTCPWEYHGSKKGILDLGEIWWIVISPELFEKDGKFKLGKWSALNKTENKEIGAVLSQNAFSVIHRAQEFKILFYKLYSELKRKDFGYRTKVYSLIDSILILIVRIIKSQKKNQEKNESWLKHLNYELLGDISKKWTVEEMATVFNMGTTSFNGKVKKLTGYTPSSYLTHLRIKNAKKLLADKTSNLTEIALDCGFYSSQHFSGTFLKWTGMSPSEFRKKVLAE